MATDLVQRAAAWVQGETGIRIPEHRFPSVERELRCLGGPDLAVALTRVQRDAALREQLLGAVAIPETYLFRHPGQFAALAELARRRQAQGRPCRVLSAGCSSGEEAWSAAAVLASAYRPGGHYGVDAWDLDPARLATAQSGRYRSWSVRSGLSGYDEHFRRDGEEWVVADALRRCVRFAAHNLMLPPPPGPSFDAILFRNVAIYWEPETAERVVEQLCARLAPDGLFVPGPSDPVRFPSADWETVPAGDASAFRRRAAGESRPSAGFPARAAAHAVRAPAPPRPAVTPNVPRPATATPPEAPSWMEQAAAHADAGRYREALDVLCGRPGPLPGGGRLLVGIVMLNLDRAEEAFAWIRQAVFLEPEDPSARRWLAVAHERLGRRELAEREVRNAQELERHGDRLRTSA